MGKAKQSEKKKSFRNVPLGQQLLEDSSVKPTIRQKKRKREEEDDTYVDEKTARKILRSIEKQREELGSRERTEGSLYLRSQKADSDAESEEDAKVDSDAGDDNDSDVEVDEAVLAQFSKFENCDGSDMMESVKEKETEIMTGCSNVTDSRPHAVIEPALKQSCVRLGQLLKAYRSGKLPKLFKQIPRFRIWEDILELTKPEEWSAAAMREGTKMFISNFKEAQAKKFLEMYLLPRVRDDFATYKRLNPHLFQAIKKSLYKAGAFMDGFVIPLCESGTCTLREATVVAGILKSVSIKMVHSAATLLALIKLPYSGATMLIIQGLIEKKYSLPLSVIQSLAEYFIGFMNDPEFIATVIWQQGLLSFVQLCKNDIDAELENRLLELIKVHRHNEISEEIRRELTAKQKID